MNIQYTDTKSGSAFAKKKEVSRLFNTKLYSFSLLKKKYFFCVFLYASFTLNKDDADVTEHFICFGFT